MKGLESLLGPTEPPGTEARAESRQYSLYTTSSVVAASLLGSFLGGGIVMALNHDRLRGASRALRAALLSAAGQFLFIFVMTRVFPGADNPMPGLVNIVVPPIVMYFLFRSLQAREVMAHRDRGGAVEPTAKAGGIGITAWGVFWALVWLGYWLWGLATRVQGA